MKKISLSFIALAIAGVGIFYSCKKGLSWETYGNNSPSDTNKPTIDVAGSDQVITLPTDSSSWYQKFQGYGWDNKYWLWKKFSDPASFYKIS